jgi:hypothetical protein
MTCQRNANPEFSKIVFDDLWIRGFVSCPHKPIVYAVGYRLEKKNLPEVWCPYLTEHVISGETE